MCNKNNSLFLKQQLQQLKVILNSSLPIVNLLRCYNLTTLTNNPDLNTELIELFYSIENINNSKFTIN